MFSFRTLTLLLALVGFSGFAQAQADEDPWEGMNRAIYSFNDGLDKAILKPIAKGYRWLMPDPAERGVSRFFSNLGEVNNLINHGLQGNFYRSANSTGRLLVNSTLGIGGLFEVADSMGMEKQGFEDFGQTLAVWGVPSGPYLMLPLLGPSTVRDAPASIPDAYLNPVTYVNEVKIRNSLRLTSLVSVRAGLLDAEETLSQRDPYAFLRDAYLQRREYEINNGEVEDSFDGEGFDDFLND